MLFTNFTTTMISSVCTVPSPSIELSLSTVHSVSTDQSVYFELIDAMSHISLSLLLAEDFVNIS